MKLYLRWTNNNGHISESKRVETNFGSRITMGLLNDLFLDVCSRRLKPYNFGEGDKFEIVRVDEGENRDAGE